jgi:hypothetical protein
MPRLPDEPTLSTTDKELRDRLRRLDFLLGLLTEVPEAWLSGSATSSNGNKSAPTMECLKCTEYQELKDSWEKAMKWTEGLDNALSVMLASVTSTMAVGDQLWIKIIGPASCGKSTLCEAISVNSKYVLAKSTIRGFHSGFGDGEQDHSLLSQVAGKTLVTKDGDTLLQSPNLGQVLSEARDVYDTTSRTSYRNKSSRDYSGIRMTWLLCGTSSLRSIDSSELGERFLDCVIMDGINDELEDEILMRVASRSEKNLSFETDGTVDTQQDPDMTKAMQLTGGYITHLRENASDLLASINFSDESLRKCTRLGKFVAYVRARPSKLQEENAEREFAARLVSQLIRLSKCLAAVLNKPTVDEDILSMTKKVAMDTARGQTFDILEVMYEQENEGIEPAMLTKFINGKDSETRRLLRFLRRIGAVETFEKRVKAKTNTGVVRKVRWKMTDYMTTLFEEVQEM